VQSYPAIVRPPAEAIGTLSLIVGGIALLIFIGVQGALLYAIWRYRASRQAAAELSAIESNRRLEIAWTAAPAVILAFVFALMLGTIAEVNGAAVAPTLRITAVGHQWWWEYRYGGAVTANELHIPINTSVELELHSADVIHSWWVPEIAGKIDMVPGQTNRIRISANRLGTFEGQCGEFCGIEHAWMRLRVIVEKQEDFDRWLRVQGQTVAPQGSAGEIVFLATTCVNCHAIRGTAASGTAGPDLTHVAGRGTIGAGVLPNDLANMRAWLADPQRYKPGAFMPRIPLADHDLDALAEYMASLR
jgi:cytochrome c oxidase subunit II